jgi:hypothetical protein
MRLAVGFPWQDLRRTFGRLNVQEADRQRHLPQRCAET